MVKNAFIGIVALLLLPVATVAALSAGTGVLKGTLETATDATRVYGYSLADLEALPEASLSVPASTRIGTIAIEASRFTTGGEYPALAGGTYGTHLERRDVRQFYDDQLEANGWEPMTLTDLYRANFRETAALTWSKGDLVMRLSFLDTDQLATTYRTVYRTQLQPIEPAGNA